MKKIDYSEFIRAFKVIPKEGIGFFLGSECSVSAGIPTGNQLIWEFKRNIYCSSNKIKEENFSNLGLKSNQEKIQKYFDAINDTPDFGSPACSGSKGAKRVVELTKSFIGDTVFIRFEGVQKWLWERVEKPNPIKPVDLRGCENGCFVQDSVKSRMSVSN